MLKYLNQRYFHYMQPFIWLVDWPDWIYQLELIIIAWFDEAFNCNHIYYMWEFGSKCLKCIMKSTAGRHPMISILFLYDIIRVNNAVGKVSHLEISSQRPTRLHYYMEWSLIWVSTNVTDWALPLNAHIESELDSIAMFYQCLQFAKSFFTH